MEDLEIKHVNYVNNGFQCWVMVPLWNVRISQYVEYTFL